MVVRDPASQAPWWSVLNIHEFLAKLNLSLLKHQHFQDSQVNCAHIPAYLVVVAWGQLFLIGVSVPQLFPLGSLAYPRKGRKLICPLYSHMLVYRELITKK